MKKQIFAGKFEIQGEIAKGQTGTIYYGYDMGLRQEVAIKVYHSHINGRLIRGQAFIEKAKPLLLINHPNLIKIFKVEEEDGTPVVFMELFDAPSLEQMIHDQGPFTIQDMLLLSREITEVLVHTHFQGIIHGTLHPGHVLVGPQGQIKVMDMGLSWILMDILSNCDDELLRPLPYFPPEIAKGELLNVSSDLYCLGFMMYEMLTGSVPYSGLPKTSIMGKLAFDQKDPVFNFPDEVPETICDLIRQMTRNKTQQRLQDATHILTILNQQLSKLPLNNEGRFLPSTPLEPQAPSPKEPTEPEKPSTTSTPSSAPEPTLEKTPPVRRPQASMDYDSVKYKKTLRTTVITLGLILLLGGAGILGFWYRDSLDPHISGFQTEPEHPAQETSLPQTMPVEGEIAISPTQDSLNIQEPQLDTEEPTKNGPQSLTTLEEPTINSAEKQPIPPIGKGPLQDSTSQKANTVQQTKQPATNVSPASVKQQTPKRTLTIPQFTPLPTTNTPKKAPLQGFASSSLDQIKRSCSTRIGSAFYNRG